jgi:hypothetical protein
MAIIEKIVRPYATNTYAPPIRGLQDPKIPEPTIIRINPGSGKVLSNNMSASGRWYKDMSAHEVSRRT